MATNNPKKASAKPIAVSPATGRSPALKSSFPLHLKLALLLALIAFAVYANTLQNGFTMDDTVMIVKNTIVKKGITAIPELLSTPHQRGYWQIPNDEYRPLSLVAFCIGYQFFADNPVPYHLLSVLLFAACVALLFIFLYKLFDGKRTAAAFIASLLFALHPIHTEVVANVKSCDELMCFFFAFLSLNVFMKYAAEGKAGLLFTGVLCLFLSFLAKETVITFLVIIPVVFFLFKNENKKRSGYIFAGTALVAIIFLGIRYAVLTHYNAGNTAGVNMLESIFANKDLSLESRIATIILVLGMYVKLLFVPYPLICDYSYNSIPYTHFSNPYVIVALVFYAFIIFIAAKRFINDRKDPYVFGILLFLATTFLISNIPLLIKSTMAERFMFYPSVGFCLIAGLLIAQWIGARDNTVLRTLKQPKALGVLIPLCVIYVVITTGRNRDWNDNYTLYKADVEKAPGNSRLNYLLGYELLNMAKQETNKETRMELLGNAVSYSRRSLAIYPGYYYAETDLGAAYFLQGRYDSAEIYDLAAIKLSPGLLQARMYLSEVYLNTRQYRKDISLCKESVELSGDNISAFADIAESYLQLEKYDSAIQYLNRGIAANPRFYAFYAVYSDLYTKTGNKDSAKKYEYIAQKLSSP